MIKTLILLALIAGATWGLGILIDTPGSLTLVWFGERIETSPLVGLAFVLATAVVLGLIWTLLRFLFHFPSILTLANRARSRARGLEALSRGIVAAGAGDLQRAQRASAEAKKHLPAEPLTLLLEAQTAQLAGDRFKAQEVFRAMSARADTKMLGLRGLHAESLRQGDQETAHALAVEAQNTRPMNWSGQAVFDRHTAARDWEAAERCVAQNLRAKVVDPATARRQKAVLDTAIAMDIEQTDPARAIKLLRAAVSKEPDLVPAAALLGRLLARKGDFRAAAKMLEAVYAKAPHPDLAHIYVGMRSGDSAAERLARAKTLARGAPDHPESAMTIAAAAIDAREFAEARRAMAPLVASGQRPTARMCLLMAELEDREHGAQGLVREWLSRATRAPRDAMWHADGHWYKQWSPVSPVTGKLDVCRWAEPMEELTGPVEEPPPAYQPPGLDGAPSAVIEAAGESGSDSEPPPPEPAPEPKAEILEPEQASAASIAPRTTPQPVIFPMATPPDDPGPKTAAASATRMF
jgi:HemY protein